MKNKIVNKIKEVLARLWFVINKPMVGVLPGQIAFFLVLSIFPILILIGLIGSTFDISIGTILDFFKGALPKEIIELLANFLDGKGFDTNIGFSMISGFLIASNGAHSIIMASNTLYGFPNDSYIKRRIKALFIIILLMLLFFLTFFVLAFGNIILKIIFEVLDMSDYLSLIYHLFIYFKWPVVMFFMFFVIKLIYTIAPDWNVLSQQTTRGAWFTTIGWIVATFIYSCYVNYFTSYDIFYGSLSSIVVMMIWIYVLSYILVVGIAINVSDYEINHRD